MDTSLVLNALHRAFQTHRPTPGLILHSDRGSQYCSGAYQQAVASYQMVCSMSRTGNCYDNAPMESFWSVLKNELVYRKVFESHAQAIRDISEYIEIFYNRQRRQAVLGYLSLAVFARRFKNLGWQRPHSLASEFDDLSQHGQVSGIAFERRVCYDAPCSKSP